MKTVDEYIQTFPPEMQRTLAEVRNAILSAAPDADEMISYSMPAYKLKNKVLVYFAGYKNHVGLYATPSGHEEFAKDLARYKQGKGSVQFPLTEPMPLNLIKKIVKFRVKENKGIRQK